MRGAAATLALAAAAAAREFDQWCASPPAARSHTPPPPQPGAEFRGAFRDLALWVEKQGQAPGDCEQFYPHRRGSDGLWVVEFDHSLDLWREQQRAGRKGVPVLLRRGLTLVLGGGEEVPDRLGYDACGMETDKRVISVPGASVRGPKPMARASRDRMMREARTRRPAVSALLERVSRSRLGGFIEHMQEYETRNSYSGNNGLNQAADWAADQFRDFGFNVTRYSFRNDMTPQIVAELPGVGAPEQVVVVGAHYDSRGTQSSSPTQRAPGADDNGSGSAALLELARIIQEHGARFRHTLRLMLYTGEEQGLIGSRAIAREYAGDGVDVVASFNADMIGWKRTNAPITLAFMNRYVDMDLTEITMETVRTYVPQLPVDFTSGCCSDQQSWYENGYPAVGFFETPTSSVVYPEYHRSGDLLSLLNLEQIELQATATMASAALWADIL